MLTAGLDLAAQPAATSLAVIDWQPNSARLLSLELGVADTRVIELSNQVDKLGIDCALGWPLEFIEFLNRYAQLVEAKPVIDGGIDWRRQISFRESDREVRRITGRWPLSVATDRLGLTAMRAAGLLSKLQEQGIDIDRAGFGKIVEIYPGASLRLWQFETAGYRTSAQIRQKLIARLQQNLPGLDLANFIEIMVSSCDAFDAVIASLAARASAIGQSTAPSASQVAVAKIEGWIHLPKNPITQLLEF